MTHLIREGYSDRITATRPVSALSTSHGQMCTSRAR